MQIFSTKFNKKERGTTMAKNWLTDEQVEQEIERLKNSDHVKLARKDEQIRYRRRKYLYTLRAYEKMGKELEKAGVTFEMLDKLDKYGEEVE